MSNNNLLVSNVFLSLYKIKDISNSFFHINRLRYEYITFINFIEVTEIKINQF